MAPDTPTPPDTSGAMDPYTHALALFDQRERVLNQQLETWVLSVARHNDRLRTAGQRLADQLAAMRTDANSDDIDHLINAWRHANNHAS